MSSYTKVIIFILVLIIFSVTVIYLYNSENAMNEVMPEISSYIAKGDSDYNEAVKLLNGKNYNEARNKAISAQNNFNHSMSLLLSIKDNFTSDTGDIHKNYINTVLSELGLKINATEYLLKAINCYQNYENSTGNGYAEQANSIMKNALDFQKVRVDLVKNNTKLFK